MNEPDETPGDNVSVRPSPFRALRKVVYALGALVIIWLVFGETVPRLFFADTPDAPTTAAPKTPPVDSAARQQIEALAERVNSLEAKLKTFEDIVAAAPPPAPAAPPPPESIAPPPAPIEWERVEKLEEKIAALESLLGRHQQAANDTVEIYRAFSQMKEAALRGDRFQSQHAALAKRIHGHETASPLLEQLASAAETGIQTLAQLEKAFSDTIPKALAKPSSGSLLSNVGSLVSIRKVGEQAGNDDQAVIARAEVKISRADVTGAMRELATLSPPAATAFSGWIAEVQAYQRSRELLDAIELALAEPRVPNAVPGE
jgi:hypothetical protein